jgi:glycosyltransferase involved in cell wall biosynthesis
VTVELSRDSHRAHAMVPEALRWLRAAEADVAAAAGARGVRARRRGRLRDGGRGRGRRAVSAAAAAMPGGASMPPAPPVPAPPLRICFLSRRFFPAVSGMSVYAANLLRELVAAGHDVTMVSQYRADAAGRGVYGGGPPPPVPGVRVLGLESVGEADGGDFERDVEALVDAVCAEHARRPFDLLHAQYGYPTGFAALEASRRLGVPNVVSIQGGDGHWVGPCCTTHRDAMRAVLDHAGALLIGSRSFAGEVEHNHGVPTDRFTIVPGAVDVARFRPRPAWRAGALADPARPVLLYHGRVDRRKGALDVVDAVAAVIATRGAAGAGDVPHDAAPALPHLVVSGIGPDVEAVRERVRAHALDAHVTLTGAAAYDAVPLVYHAGDVFVSPTYAEGFSNTILEAMASGLPVLSTHAVGVVDCLRDGENGLLVPPGDVAALAAAIARLLDDAPLRARLAGAALDEVRRTYAWPAVARQITDVYATLAGTRPSTTWTPPAGRDPTCRFRAAPHLL